MMTTGSAARLSFCHSGRPPTRSGVARRISSAEIGVNLVMLLMLSIATSAGLGDADTVDEQLVMIIGEAGGEEIADVLARHGVAEMPAQHGHPAQRFEPGVGEPRLGARLAEQGAERDR